MVAIGRLLLSSEIVKNESLLVKDQDYLKGKIEAQTMN